jgi:NAD(P)H-dependent flavin oxidoreductase YrpB (nitropropane dioxygenase family)
MTELFGIKHPIMLSGMNWLTTPKLVAAVSNAGGLGVLAGSQYGKERIKDAIKQIRDLTDKPFGINMTLGIGSREVVPMVIEVTMLSCRVVDVPAVVPGRYVVDELKKGTSSPTLINAVWLFSVRNRGFEITSTLPCCSRAVMAARVLKFVNTMANMFPPAVVAFE